jgi:DNA replication protein DnaC
MWQVARRATHSIASWVDSGGGYTHLTPAQAHALFELVNARYEKGAIILTSNTSFAEWGGLLGNEVLASALLDRLLHLAKVFSINGPSFRMKERLPTGKVPVSA